MNSLLAIDLYEILFSEFIVCRGFSELLIALLERIGINATFYSVEVEKNSENLTIEDYATLNAEERRIKTGTKDYHSRVIFRLIDEKYGIDGIFISDVTWDQHGKHDYYNHAAMTPYETRFENDRFYNTDIDIFDIESSTEFYQKLQKFPGSIEAFLKVIKVIDIDFFKYLVYKYDIEGPYTTDFFIDVYNYIIIHTKKRIDKDTLFKALMTVMDFTYINLNREAREGIISNLKRDYEHGEEEFFQEDIGRKS